MKDDRTFNVEYILSRLLRYKRFILISSLVLFVLSIIIMFGTPKMYSSRTSFILQVSQGKKINSSFSSVAKLVGINVGASGSDNLIYPALYPIIFESGPFQKRLLESEITSFKEPAPITINNYLEKYSEKSSLDYILEYTIGLPFKVLGWFRSDDGVVLQENNTLSNPDLQIVQLTPGEIERIGRLYEKLSLSVNEENGLININTTFPEPEAAAQIASIVQKQLQSFIIESNILKTKTEYEYLKARLEEVEEDYQNKRAALANYQDRNINIRSNIAMNRLSQLENDFNLSSEVYSNVLSEYESMKLQLKRDTPVFMTIEPPVVQMRPSSPKKLRGIVLISFFGSIIIVVLVYLKIILQDYLKLLVRSE